MVKKGVFSSVYKDSNRGSDEDESNLRYHPAEEGEENDGRVKPIDNRYGQIVKEGLKHVDPESQPAVAQIFAREDAIRFYNQLVRDKVPKPVIRDVMINSLEDFGRGKKPKIGAYLVAAGKHLLEIDRKYRSTMREAYENEIISSEQYEAIDQSLADSSVKAIRHAKSHLESLARAAVWIFIVMGIVLILTSGLGVTGAVIGGAARFSWMFFVGLVFFVIGAILKFRN